MGGLAVFSFFFFLLCMDILRIGALNISGGRDRERRRVLTELSRNKIIDVFLLQKTNSSLYNVVEWGRIRDGHFCLSQRTNLSAGEGILFSHHFQFTNQNLIHLQLPVCLPSFLRMILLRRKLPPSVRQYMCAKVS